MNFFSLSMPASVQYADYDGGLGSQYGRECVYGYHKFKLSSRSRCWNLNLASLKDFKNI